MEATTPRGQLFEDIYGDGIAAAKNCAGSHIHFEKSNVRRQLDLLTALDPMLALVSASPYYRGERHLDCSRALAYRSDCGREFQQFCRLLEYVDSVESGSGEPTGCTTTFVPSPAGAMCHEPPSRTTSLPRIPSSTGFASSRNSRPWSGGSRFDAAEPGSQSRGRYGVTRGPDGVKAPRIRDDRGYEQSSRRPELRHPSTAQSLSDTERLPRAACQRVHPRDGFRHPEIRPPVTEHRRPGCAVRWGCVSRTARPIRTART